jgi:predicted transcriptional regulator
MTLTKEQRETAEGQLCMDARKVVELVYHRINEHRFARAKTDYPNTPSESDFLQYLGPRIRAAIKKAVLEETKHSLERQAQQTGRELYLIHRTIELQNELDDLNEEIRANPL